MINSYVIIVEKLLLIVERKDKTGHLRNIIVTANSNIPGPGGGYSHRHSHFPRHPSQQTYISNYRVCEDLERSI